MQQDRSFLINVVARQNVGATFSFGAHEMNYTKNN